MIVSGDVLTNRRSATSSAWASWEGSGCPMNGTPSFSCRTIPARQALRLLDCDDPVVMEEIFEEARQMVRCRIRRRRSHHQHSNWGERGPSDLAYARNSRRFEGSLNGPCAARVLA
jgi:hypothetical protein